MMGVSSVLVGWLVAFINMVLISKPQVSLPSLSQIEAFFISYSTIIVGVWVDNMFVLSFITIYTIIQSFHNHTKDICDMRWSMNKYFHEATKTVLQQQCRCLVHGIVFFIDYFCMLEQRMILKSYFIHYFSFRKKSHYIY